LMRGPLAVEIKKVPTASFEELSFVAVWQWENILADSFTKAGCPNQQITTCSGFLYMWVDIHYMTQTHLTCLQHVLMLMNLGSNPAVTPVRM
jgi:hypothetical protein